MSEKVYLINELPKKIVYSFLQKFLIRTSQDYESAKNIYHYAKDRGDMDDKQLEFYEGYSLEKLNVKMIAEYLFKNWKTIDWKKINSPITDIILDYDIKKGIN